MELPSMLIAHMAQSIWSADPREGESWQNLSDERRERLFAAAKGALDAVATSLLHRAAGGKDEI